MARWKCILTDAGTALLAGATGKNLNIVKAQCGSGMVDEAVLAAQTSIENVKANLSLMEPLHSGNTTQIRLQLKNADLNEAFELRQIGIFAALNDGEPVLYMMLQNSEPDTIPSAAQSPNYVYDCLVNLIIGNAENVTAQVNTAAFVSVGEMAARTQALGDRIDSAVAELDDAVGAMEADFAAHTSDRSNPHEVTAAQVGAVPTSRTVNGKALSGDVSLSASDVGAAASSHYHAAADIVSGVLSTLRGGTGVSATSVADVLAGLFTAKSVGDVVADSASCYINFGGIKIAWGKNTIPAEEEAGTGLYMGFVEVDLPITYTSAYSYAVIVSTYIGGTVTGGGIANNKIGLTTAIPTVYEMSGSVATWLTIGV